MNGVCLQFCYFLARIAELLGDKNGDLYFNFKTNILTPSDDLTFTLSCYLRFNGVWVVYIRFMMFVLIVKICVEVCILIYLTC